MAEPHWCGTTAAGGPLMSAFAGLSLSTCRCASQPTPAVCLPVFLEPMVRAALHHLEEVPGCGVLLRHDQELQYAGLLAQQSSSIHMCCSVASTARRGCPASHGLQSGRKICRRSEVHDHCDRWATHLVCWSGRASVSLRGKMSASTATVAQAHSNFWRARWSRTAPHTLYGPVFQLCSIAGC